MSTGKRLAKRSIIGTRVAAPGHDGKYYTGSIHALKSPASAPGELGLTITPDTRYVIRFDQTPGARNPDSTREYQHKFIIGPGFGLVSSTTLVPGQKVYLTYNGREINAEVIQHRKELEEVDVSFAPSGQEGTMTLTRRIEEIRLLESRKSARLADQDTDFARLADMGGDRKRASSHSIEVPHVLGSRKRRPSTSSEYEKSYSGAGSASSSSGSGNPGTSEAGIPHRCARAGCGGYSDGSDCMDECAAALVLMSLSCSPHSPHGLPLQCQRSYGSWAEQSTTAPMVGSPGAGASSSSSSGASWRTGTPSPSLSEEGVPTNGSVWPLPAQQQTQQQQHQLAYPGIVSGLPFEGTPNGALDEGIVPDYLVDMHPQKKKIRSRNNRVVENNSPTNRKKLYKCNWRGCGKIKATCHLIEDHVRQAHLRKPRGLKAESKDEEFYYDELTLDHVSSPPTMSHRDMARPPHEDPEYQKLLRLEAAPPPVATSSGSVLSVGDPAMEQKFAQQHLDEDHQEDQRQMLHIQQQQQQHQQQQHQQQQQQQQHQQPKADEASALTVQLIEQLQHRFPQKGTGAAAKQLKLSPRPLPTNGQAQNIRLVAFQSGKVTTRKSRSDTKKCRKVYGMTNREQWCTQCKWKKACTRFGE